MRWNGAIAINCNGFDQRGMAPCRLNPHLHAIALDGAVSSGSSERAAGVGIGGGGFVHRGMRRGDSRQLSPSARSGPRHPVAFFAKVPLALLACLLGTGGRPTAEAFQSLKESIMVPCVKKSSVIVGLILLLGLGSTARAQGGSAEVINNLGIEQVVRMQVAGAKSLAVWLAITNANKADVRMTDSTFHLYIIDRAAGKRVEIGVSRVKEAITYGIESIPPIDLRCVAQATGCTVIKLDIDMAEGCPNLAAIFNVLGEPDKEIDVVAEITGYFGVKSTRGYVEHPSRAELTFKSKTESAILIRK